MAVCDYCEQEMSDELACVPWPDLERIPYGSEQRFGPTHAEDWPADKKCHDCAVKRGELHHPGCDMEECPMCGRQAISCGDAWPGETVEPEEITAC